MDNERELMDAILGGDDEPLLPDGWKEGDDIFADADDAEEVFGADEQEDLSALTGENEEESSEETDPTTAGETETDHIPNCWWTTPMCCTGQDRHFRQRGC